MNRDCPSDASVGRDNGAASHDTLTALVLAAGLSRRFGQPKQLLPYRGTTLLGWIAAQVESCPAMDDVILTLGQDSDEILASLTLRRAHPVVAQDYQEGCAASYRTGLAAADPQTRGLMIVPGDQPGIDAAIIGRMADAWRAALRGDAHDGFDNPPNANHAAILVASYQGVDGQPLIFDRSLFAELADLHGDKAAWKLLDRHPGAIQRVEMGRAAPANINTPEDYARLMASETLSAAMTNQPIPSLLHLEAQPEGIDDARWRALLADSDSNAMLEEMGAAALAEDESGLTWDVDDLFK